MIIGLAQKVSLDRAALVVLLTRTVFLITLPEKKYKYDVSSI